MKRLDIKAMQAAGFTTGENPVTFVPYMMINGKEFSMESLVEGPVTVGDMDDYLEIVRVEFGEEMAETLAKFVVDA